MEREGKWERGRERLNYVFGFWGFRCWNAFGITDNGCAVLVRFFSALEFRLAICDLRFWVFWVLGFLGFGFFEFWVFWVLGFGLCCKYN